MYGGGGGDAEAAWKMGRIMLRFRPIAPRPAVSFQAVASAIAELSPLGRKRGRKSVSGRCRGRKARKVEAKASRSSKYDRKASTSSASSSSTTTSTTICSPTIVTLPLMPVAEEKRDELAERRSPGSERQLLVPCPLTSVGSWVMVECVTDTWRDGEVAWRSDEAVRAALAADECPGLVSDEGDRVTWANAAYRRMVAGAGSDVVHGGGGAGADEVRVGLVARAVLPAAGTCRAFTCRMRVHYARPERRADGASSLAAPCDVWRLDGGGSAWRIDVKTALRLSL